MINFKKKNKLIDSENEIKSVPFKDRCIRNLKNPLLSIGTVVLIVLFVVQYLSFDLSTSNTFRTLEILDSSLTFFDLLLLTVISSKRNTMVWLGYSILAKVFSMAFGVLGHDTAIAYYNSLDPTIIQIFQVVGYLVSFSTIMLGIILVPFLFLSLIFNAIDYFIYYKSSKNYEKNKKKLSSWSVIWTIIEVAIFWGIYKYLVYKFYLTTSSDVFEIIIAKLKSGEILRRIFGIIKPLLAFAFMPLLFIVNTYKKGDIFYGKTFQIYAAIQITFLAQYITLIDNNEQMYIPKIMISVLVVKLLLILKLGFKTIKLNYKEYKKSTPIPYIFSVDKKYNEFFKSMYLHNEKKKNKMLLKDK